MNRLWLACVFLGAVGVTVAGCGETSTEGAGPIEGYVCGTDGKTYSVEDAALGENEVEHRGSCDEPMQCESPDDCFVGDECMPAPWAAGEGGDNDTDPAIFPSDPDLYWCIPGPTRCNCPGLFEPVCGGDGRNYINACEAACAGVGIRHEGYCEEPPGEGCVRAGCSDQLCVEEGVDIASTCEWRPVYECYQRATCERQQNGQCGFTPTHELVECLEHFGDLCALIDCAPGYVCEAGQCIPRDGGCDHDYDCPVGWICQDVILESPDYEGVCEPCACPENYSPVCGLDGRTYGNACEARCAHVRVAYEGECRDDCRTQGCDDGSYCGYCWSGWACIPEGAVC